MSPLLEALARFVLPALGGFVHRGVIVLHPGVLVDQAAIATAIERASRAVEARTMRGATDPFLRRVRVRIGPPSPSSEVQGRAWWTGGFFDRGIVELAGAEEALAERLESALTALLEVALDVPRLVEASRAVR